MSDFQDFIMHIRKDIEDGFLDFTKIAQKHNADIYIVNGVKQLMQNLEESEQSA